MLGVRRTWRNEAASAEQVLLLQCLLPPKDDVGDVRFSFEIDRYLDRDRLTETLWDEHSNTRVK